MILRDDRYITIDMNIERSLYITRWKKESGEITDESVVKEIIGDISAKIE